MSFLKSIIKEVHTAKSLLDIPSLKNERERLNRRLQSERDSKKTYHNIIEHTNDINQTIQDLIQLEPICYEGQPEQLQHAQSVIEHLRNCVKTAEFETAKKNENIAKLEQDIQKINDKLSAARAVV